MNKRVAIVDAPIDVTALYTSMMTPAAGALSIFLGTVREVNDGRGVTGIDYDAYRPMAQAELERIASEVEAAVPGAAIAVVHRLGTLTVGDISIAIVAAHQRRGAAMKATEQVIEQVKKRVPIWKLEHYVDGERQWVDPTVTS